MFRLSRYIIRLALVVAACGMFTACGPTAQQIPTAVPAPSPTVAGTNQTVGAPVTPLASTAVPTAEGDAAILASIQEALDLYARAYSEHSIELLNQAIDQENAPFRRFMQSGFDTNQSSSTKRHYTAQSILKHLPYGFVLTRVEQQSGGVADVTFRKVNNRWILSEPTEAQLGERKQLNSEHFTFFTYPWIDDINPDILTAMENARDNVQRALGKVPDQQALIYVNPIFGLGSPVGSDIRASYIHDRKQPRIEVFAPWSYPFGFYDPAEGWKKQLEQLLTHEYTHLANDLSFVPIVRMSGWMSEGLAEYVAGVGHTEAIREAVHSDQIIPIIDTESSVLDKQDLQHFGTLQAGSEESYGFAYSLVAYIVDRHGGLDGFWKLVGAYDKTQDLDKALQQAFGIDYTQFDKDWRAWLKTTYS